MGLSENWTPERERKKILVNLKIDQQKYPK